MTKLIGRRHRRDGWIARRQVDSLRALREGAAVTQARPEVGLGTTGADRAGVAQAIFPAVIVYKDGIAGIRFRKRWRL